MQWEYIISFMISLCGLLNDRKKWQSETMLRDKLIIESGMDAIDCAIIIN